MTHVPQWTHEADCTVSDPVNVIWEGPGITLNDVLNHFDNMGWEPPGRIVLWPEGTHQYLPASEGKQRQSEQRLFAIIPIPLLRYAVRFHIRLWATRTDQVIGSAHYERVRLAPPGHHVISFETAEQRVAQDFAWPPSQWNVRPTSHPMGNPMTRQRKAYNDGIATIIKK